MDNLASAPLGTAAVGAGPLLSAARLGLQTGATPTAGGVAEAANGASAEPTNALGAAFGATGAGLISSEATGFVSKADATFPAPKEVAFISAKPGAGLAEATWLSGAMYCATGVVSRETAGFVSKGLTASAAGSTAGTCAAENTFNVVLAATAAGKVPLSCALQLAPAAPGDCALAVLLRLLLVSFADSALGSLVAHLAFPSTDPGTALPAIICSKLANSELCAGAAEEAAGAAVALCATNSDWTVLQTTLLRLVLCIGKHVQRQFKRRKAAVPPAGNHLKLKPNPICDNTGIPWGLRQNANPWVTFAGDWETLAASTRLRRAGIS